MFKLPLLPGEERRLKALRESGVFGTRQYDQGMLVIAALILLDLFAVIGFASEGTSAAYLLSVIFAVPGIMLLALSVRPTIMHMKVKRNSNKGGTTGKLRPMRIILALCMTIVSIYWLVTPRPLPQKFAAGVLLLSGLIWGWSTIHFLRYRDSRRQDME